MLTPTNKIQIDSDLYINQYFLHDNNINKIDLPQKRTVDLAGFSVHNTNQINAVDQAEQYTRATVNGNMNTVRVHYYVDENSIWHNMKDIYQNWSCADGNGAGNSSTIAIECIMSGISSEKDKKALENCKKLVAYLLNKYNMTTDNLYTHTHWLNVRDGVQGTREELNVKPHPYKVCPYYIIPYWSEFLEDINKLIGIEPAPAEPEVLYKIQVGAFSNITNANNYLQEVKGVYPNAFIVVEKNK